MSIAIGQSTFANINNDSIPHEKSLIYLDSNLNVVTDNSNAVFSYYTYLINGKNIYPKLKNYSGNNYELKMKLNNSSMDKKLNGIITYFDSKGRMSSQHTFKNGEYISIKEFDKKGRLQQYFDFREKSSCDSLSYCVYQNSKKRTSIKSFYIQRNENGEWPRTK